MSGRWHTSNRRQRLPRNWRAIRAARLRMDGHRCTWIVDGERCPARATDVDHLEAMVDDHRLEALQSLCSMHHRAKSSAEGNGARRVQRARGQLPAEDHPGLRRRRSEGPGG